MGGIVVYCLVLMNEMAGGVALGENWMLPLDEMFNSKKPQSS